MNRLFIAFIAAMVLTLAGCSDHDDPQLAPIDTSKVKISAKVSLGPDVAWGWYEAGQEITVKVADVSMTAPKGVVLRSIELLENGATVAQKPYSGETLEFKVPLVAGYMGGRRNSSVIGNLIKQNSRDAQTIIADNLQAIVFSVMPEFDCEATLDIAVKGRSTSGEELGPSFQVKAADGFTIAVPQSELYWTPNEGSAPTLDVSMTASAMAFSTNSTLEAKVSRVYWGTDHSTTPTISVRIDNVPGSLEAKRLGIIVDTERYGTWEGVNTGQTSLLEHFSVKEAE